MKKKFLMLALVVFTLLFVGCGGKSEKSGTKENYTVYLGCDSPEDTVTYILLDKFASLMEEKSNGRISAKKFSNAKLGGDVEMIEGLQNGKLTFVVQTTAPQVNFVPEVGIFDIAMLFPNIEVARTVLDGPLLEEIKKYYEQQDIRLYGYADQGFREMSSNIKINEFNDLKGVKIRTMSNPNHIAFWQSVGANPTPMNFGELYIGLQQGVVDAQENPLETIIAAKLHEQQKYMVMTNHVIHALSLIGSSKIIDTYPEEIQNIIEDAAKEAIVYARQKTDERTQSRIDILTESGVEIIDFNQNLYDDMKKASEGVNNLIRRKLPKDLIGKLDAAMTN